MKWYVATATIPISVSVEFGIDENSTKQEIKEQAKKFIDAEINELLGGIDFTEDNTGTINIEPLD